MDGGNMMPGRGYHKRPFRFADREVKAVAEILEEEGWLALRRTGEGHYLYRHETGPVISLPGTPSDHRFKDNTLAQARRKVREQDVSDAGDIEPAKEPTALEKARADYHRADAGRYFYTHAQRAVPDHVQQRYDEARRHLAEVNPAAFAHSERVSEGMRKGRAKRKAEQPVAPVEKKKQVSTPWDQLAPEEQELKRAKAALNWYTRDKREAPQHIHDRVTKARRVWAGVQARKSAFADAGKPNGQPPRPPVGPTQAPPPPLPVPAPAPPVEQPPAASQSNLRHQGGGLPLGRWPVFADDTIAARLRALLDGTAVRLLTVHGKVVQGMLRRTAGHLLKIELGDFMRAGVKREGPDMTMFLEPSQVVGFTLLTAMTPGEPIA